MDPHSRVLTCPYCEGEVEIKVEADHDDYLICPSCDHLVILRFGLKGKTALLKILPRELVELVKYLNLKTEELDFDKIDTWVKSKYCIFCRARNRSLEYDHLEAEYHKEVKLVFNNLLEVKPIVMDSMEKVEALHTTLRTIVQAGGRVFVITGT